MLNGDIKVKDVPAAWNEAFAQFFGMTPPDDAHGCLQDIHWSMGGLGYFSTYTLGNFNAAQLFSKANEEQAIAQACDSANYLPILEWMRKNIHSHGKRYLPQDLIKRATGEETKAEYHLTHLRKRYIDA